MAVSMMQSIQDISFEQFNNLPQLHESIDAMKEKSNSNEQEWINILKQCVGDLLYKHKLENILQAHLVHKHYNLNENEKQVARIEKNLNAKNNDNNIFNNKNELHLIAKPTKCDENSLLIPYKWRLVKNNNNGNNNINNNGSSDDIKDDSNNGDNNGNNINIDYVWQAYEYFDSNMIDNSQEFSNNALKFINNKEFQYELASMLIKFDIDNIIGLALHFTPIAKKMNNINNNNKDTNNDSDIDGSDGSDGSMSIEINSNENRESKLLLLFNNWKQNKQYLDIIQSQDSVNTTWSFQYQIISNTLSCIVCHKCICHGCK